MNTPEQTAYLKRWRAANKDKVKRNDRRWRYGISDDEYMAALFSQEGMCPVCRCGLTEGGRASTGACVDHCHDTGRFRGVLCRNCNRGLGLLGDDATRVSALLGYVNSGTVV